MVEENKVRNREDILRQKEIKAKADLAELGHQGKSFGAGFAEGVAERERILKEEGFKPYEGTVKGRPVNFGLLIMLTIFGLVILWNLVSRFL